MKGRAHEGLLAVAMMTALVGLNAGRARATSVESLLEPGKVSAKHTKTEEECGACHDRVVERAAQPFAQLLH